MNGTLPDAWRCWVAENVLLNLTDDAIVNTVAAQGFDHNAVLEEIRQAKEHPYLKAGVQVSQRLRKMESLLQVRVELARQNLPDLNVPCVYNLPAEEFRARYYAENRPVKLLGLIEDWPALRLWSPDHFRLYFGHEMVDITTGRDSDPDYEINLDRHRQTVRFADFIDAVVSSQGNDSYLVANNHFFGRPGMNLLLNDVGYLPGYLTEENRAAHTYLWFGPGGTLTELHHDTMNILFCQIYGRKRIILVAPDELPWIYNDHSVYSPVKVENPDLQRYPLFQYANPIEVIVEPGEVLFIPVGWWHHVRSLETSISVSFTNFPFPNEYHWSEPDIRR
jgi:Cupin-like domain